MLSTLTNILILTNIKVTLMRIYKVQSGRCLSQCCNWIMFFDISYSNLVKHYMIESSTPKSMLVWWLQIDVVQQDVLHAFVFIRYSHCVQC